MYIAQHEIEKVNPWGSLTDQAPFVLPEDRPYLKAYEEDDKVKTSSKVRLEIPPNPFIGSPFHVKALLLTKSPAWDDANIADYQDNADYAEQMRQNLTFANKNDPYPFYYLNPAFSGTKGYEWWQPKLADLIAACDERTDGHGQEKVAQGLFTVAYFPYHIHEYNGRCPELPSQKYSFGLVSMLRTAGVPVVILSYGREWQNRLNRLRGVAVSKANARNNFVSKGNIGEAAFAELADALSA